MRRILALGLAGANSFLDLEDDQRFGDGLCGEVPLMAASRDSRSLRLRSIRLGYPTVVKRRSVLVLRSEEMRLSVRAFAQDLRFRGYVLGAAKVKFLSIRK